MLEKTSVIAEQNPALSQVIAVEQMIVPIAKLWARSFAVADDAAIGYLSRLLLAQVQDDLAAGVSLDRIQSHFDEAAAKIIRDWFSFVLGRDLPKDGKSLAILRLAFLDANYDGKWSPHFLSRDICVQELSSRD